MKDSLDHWAIIINPKSGKKKYRKQRKYLFEMLKSRGVSFEYRITHFAGHASKIARFFVENNYRNIMVLGGDGTVSEVINGVFSAKIDGSSQLRIALIPRGTGNDWGRFWGLTSDYKKSIDVFLKGKTQLIDIGRVAYVMEGIPENHFFINSLGFGLDAAVVNLTHRLKEIFGSHSIMYSISLLLAVFTYKAHQIILKSSEREIQEGMFTMNIANGCYSGGGMKQTPNALPYDGLLDVMMAKTPRFIDIVTALIALFRGRLLQHSVIKSFQTRSLQIQCDHQVLMEADGIIVNGCSPYQVSILPRAIQMIVP